MCFTHNCNMWNLKQAECAPELAISYRAEREILLSATAFWRGQSNLEPGLSRCPKILRKRSLVFICSPFERYVHYSGDSLFLYGFLNVTVLTSFLFYNTKKQLFFSVQEQKVPNIVHKYPFFLGGQTNKVTYQSFWSLHSCSSFSREMVVFGACSKRVLSLKSPCNVWMKVFPSLKGTSFKKIVYGKENLF